MTPTRRTFLGAAAGLGVGAAPPAKPAPTGSDLGSLHPLVERMAGSPAYPLSFLAGGYRSLDEFHAKARAVVSTLLGPGPAKVDPKPEVLERVECDGYTREKVLFSTSPHLRVPAYVLVPKGLKRPAPAIVDLHSHGGMFLFGKEKVIDLRSDRGARGRRVPSRGEGNHTTMTAYHKANYDGRPTATALVRLGYVVISIDAFFFGERRLMMDDDLRHGWDRSRYSADEVKHLNQRCRGKETTLVKTLALAGLTWPGVVVRDDMRTVDYLLTRPEVDGKRIGCLGISMGGYRAAYLAAMDERIKAACVVGFMSSVAPMRKAHIDTHSWVHFLPGLHRHLDLPDVASLAAPRALLVQQCERDRLFPPEGMRESVKRIAAVYGKAGVKGRFEGRFHDEPHRFTIKMQDEAFAFLSKHLKG